MKLTSALAFASATLLGSARGCSRVLQNKYEPMVSGRSMDWGFSFEDFLFLNPPGQKMDGGAGDLSIEWTSKYGSVTSSIIGFFAGIGPAAKEYGTGIGPGEACEGITFEKDGGTDGVNTEGLAAHVLELGQTHGTEYAEPSTTEAVNISFMRWTRYVLDNFSTVAEAVEGLKTLTTVWNLCPGLDMHLGAHMALEDATGDSAIIEHVGGEMQIFHSRDNLVMTNEPSFDQQKKLLEKYEPWGGKITLPDNLPGSVGSPDRFLRLEYYIKYTPEPANAAEAIANVRSLIGTTNVPFGAPYGGGVYPTWWTSFIDLTDKIYYFDWALTPNLVWIDLGEIDWESLPGILQLQPQGIDLVGNVLCDMTTLDGKDPMLDGCAEEKSTSLEISGLRGTDVIG